MSAPDDFRDLLNRVRTGDQDAAAELVRRYEPELRLAVHVRLTEPGLRRLLDSTDICQSVLANFFLRVAAGQYDLQTPAELIKLLAVMAQNKIIDHHRKQHTDQRNQERNLPTDVSDLDVPAEQSSPSSLVANRELLEELRRRLTPEERRIHDLRTAGKSWTEIGQELGSQPNALRMRLERAISRIMGELGLEE